MMLSELISAIGQAKPLGPCPDQEVRGLAYDSRRAGAGVVFAALKGEKADGHDFVPAAAKAGALAALVEHLVDGAAGLCQIRVPHAREALALAAHEFYGRPSQKMACVGVTGTNGKTTVTYFLGSILGERGQVGVIGTVEARYQGRRIPARMTTPESVDLMALLAKMHTAKVEQVVMEISSHALAQRRAAHLALDAAVFTNLTRDHLDYHGGMTEYFQAKCRLFREVLPASCRAGKKGLAVIFVGDQWGQKMAALAREQGLLTWTYGPAGRADLYTSGEELSLAGSACTLHWPGGEMKVRTSLVGGFNLLNLMAAAGVGLGLGIEPEAVAHGIAALKAVPGRLERVSPGAPGPAVFVDYAHTDDALAHALGALGPLCPGRLICVFGAGGDRDQGKRPLMGRAVAAGADRAVLTSDNPRTEDPLGIIAMVERGLIQAGAGPEFYRTEPLRERAIAQAIAQASEGDVVLIAGKGHEDYQIIGTEKRHFDDREEAAAALAAWRAS